MATTFYDLPFTGDLHNLTCKNHPNLRWASKGPGRRIHFLGPRDATTAEAAFPDLNDECMCPLSDMVTDDE